MTDNHALVVHCSPTRLRLKLTARRGDARYLSVLANRLAECPGIASANANPLTGSVTLTANRGYDWADLDFSAHGLSIMDALLVANGRSEADFDLTDVAVQLSCVVMGQLPMPQLARSLVELLIRAALAQMVKLLTV